MSLSRRLLALPQELWGASLPPQVSGQRHGCVTLCVPHILESAVSSRPLPREALVRVRWWGEQAPGSLFRPRLLRDGGAHAHTQTHRAVAMKYPVNAEPEQLAEYFQDMRQLALDVIDRDSRKQVGQCTLSLELQRDNAVVTAEEKLAALSRDNALCEIRPSEGEQDEVLGYLAVSFDVQWTDETKLRSREQVEEVGEQVSSASSTSLPSRREWTPVVGVKEERQVVPVDAVLDEQEENVETADSRRSGGDFQRIQRLLVKGKALQQSMERAVKDKEGGGGEEVDVVVGAEAGGYLNAADELQKRPDFIGSIHVFQSIFADDASEYFSDGYLIIEAWLHTEGAKSTLLGLSKVPLSNFAAFFRNDEVGLLGYSKQILPIASVDGKFAIENPFTGYVAGYLQVRTCVGTAEQLLLWAATVKAIIKLQSIPIRFPVNNPDCASDRTSDWFER
ncbi:C2 domain [Phytophthora cinnamomi]|uniref:C2 domain n=1 Tax=Phytophthora cinnamomi TaxID=4785 RepID=UPI003559B2E9|nr:C2 domain [Phytophthora cinnamomi]